MRMRHAAVVAGLALSLMSGTARASVTYKFYDNSLGFNNEIFTYVSADFIKTNINVSASSLSSCNAFLSECESIDFLPSFQAATTSDEIKFNGVFLGFIAFTDTNDFESGALSKVGHYVEIGGSSTLDVSVSAVPLPASAPMFGAALLALGAVGYGVKRKKTAATA